MLWIVCAVVLLAAAGFPAALLIQRKLRQARTAAVLRIESACGIVEERFVRIGGIDQWIGIRGEDQNNPWGRAGAVKSASNSSPAMP